MIKTREEALHYVLLIHFNRVEMTNIQWNKIELLTKDRCNVRMHGFIGNSNVVLSCVFSQRHHLLSQTFPITNRETAKVNISHLIVGW